MACFRPVEGWRSRQPNPDTGRVPITFRMRDGWSDQPVDLPCGRCIGCKRDKANAWGLRCYHESTRWERNCFATLTYADPAPEKLDKMDCQRFFKRLRKHGFSFRYFCAGEYGPTTGRPHYHCLFFGEDFREGSDVVGYDPESKYYYNSQIQSIWSHGNVTLAPLVPASAFYTTGYTLKNAEDSDCFHIASKRPYIGHGWLAEHYENISRMGFCVVDGKKVPVPKSYLQRPEFALEFDHVRENRRDYVNNLSVDEVCKRREGLRHREINLEAASKLRRRDL